MKTGYSVLVCFLIHVMATSVNSASVIGKDSEFDGLIEPYLVINVGSGVAGLLESITVDRGDMVVKGQVLATLQSDVEGATMELALFRSEMESSIEAKREELRHAIRNQERDKGLYDRKMLSLEEWDLVKTRRNLSEIQLAEAIEIKQLAELEFKRARKVLDRMTIRSPNSGVVVERYLSPGEYVDRDPILKLAQIDSLKVEVILPVDLLPYVKVGMRATVKPESPVTSSYTATVVIVDKVVDAASGTFGVRLKLPNPGHELPPGLKCKVNFLQQ